MHISFVFPLLFCKVSFVLLSRQTQLARELRSKNLMTQPWHDHLLFVCCILTRGPYSVPLSLVNDFILCALPCKFATDFGAQITLLAAAAVEDLLPRMENAKTI